MFMEAFATGFSMTANTKPGFCLENENYTLRFEGVLCDQAKNIVSHGFENCYSWREIMELVLDATEEADTDYLIDIEEAAEDALREWLITFQGWGLLSSILDSKIHRHVVLSLAYTSANWDTDTGGEFTEEKVFDTVKYVYDNIKGKELHSLVPKFGIWFEEIIEGEKSDERKKHFTLFFNAKWALEVKFVIEKKRVNNNLKDLAAEACVKSIMIEEDIVELDIPETLYEVVREKFRDAEWVRSFWSAKQENKNRGNKSNSSADDLNLIDKDTDEEVEVEDADDLEAIEDAQNEEFLASVVDELSSDVEHVLNGELEPDFLETEPEASNNDDNNTGGQMLEKSTNGIDGLLLIWVFMFMIIAVVAYIWC